jgi:hypothetical protein
MYHSDDGRYIEWDDDCCSKHNNRSYWETRNPNPPRFEEGIIKCFKCSLPHEIKDKFTYSNDRNSEKKQFFCLRCGNFILESFVDISFYSNLYRRLNEEKEKDLISEKNKSNGLICNFCNKSQNEKKIDFTEDNLLSLGSIERVNLKLVKNKFFYSEDYHFDYKIVCEDCSENLITSNLEDDLLELKNELSRVKERLEVCSNNLDQMNNFYLTLNVYFKREFKNLINIENSKKRRWEKKYNDLENEISKLKII